MMLPTSPRSNRPESGSSPGLSVGSDRHLLLMVALGTLIVSLIWRLPEELGFIGARTGELLFALTLALALTYILRPGVRAFTRIRGIGDTPRGRSTATMAVFAGVLLALYLMFLIGFKPVQRDVKSLVAGFWPRSPRERVALIAKWQGSLREALEPYRSVLPPEVLDDPEFFPRLARAQTARSTGWLKEQSKHAGFIVELLLIPVLTFYFLTDGPAIRGEAKLLVPLPWRLRLARMADHFDFVLDGYVRGQAWMCVIAWALVTLALWAAGVPHAFTLGLIAGFTRAIPVIGPLLGAIPLLVVCLFYTHSAEKTLLLGAGFTMMHFLESKVLLPKIVGHHVDLHPVSVIISLLIGMEFFGFIGVFLAVPIAAVLKIVLVEYHLAQAQKRALESGDVSPSLAVNGHAGVAAEPAIIEPIAAAPVAAAPVAAETVSERAVSS